MFAADRASWQNPRILVLLLLIFLCGALAGALTMRAGLHEKLHRGTSYWRDNKTHFFFFDNLRKDLDLTAEQYPQLKTILDDFRQYHPQPENQIEEVCHPRK